MSMIAQEIHDLELALLRRGLEDRAAETERCGGCRRSLLIGERVFEYEAGPALCELCSIRDRNHSPAHSHIVHGPAHGHSIRIIDRRDTHPRAA